MKPAHVPGTSLGSLYDMQIRVPNITGTVTASWVGGTGAFKDAGNGNCSDGELNGPAKIDFSASRASNLYGSSSTVQPASIRSLH